EIGRPRRFLHVFYHPNTSWMTREASAGSVLFPVTIAGALFESVSLMCLAALLGLVFLYCQARILKAARGVPAWRTPAIVPLVMSSGLVEGCSITVGYAYLVGAQTASMAPLLIALLLVRGWAWFAYRDLLQREPAPAGALQALDKTNRYFMVIGIVAPLLFCCLAIADIVATISVAVACLIATSAGWLLKFDIVVKAAFKQGYGIGKLRKGRPVITAPVRRKGDPIQY
ncbi:MAG: DmsC/YnfH family molybdoenzyme membrane anchor subunit, partial [Gammaproteobacteria bacterium]